MKTLKNLCFIGCGKTGLAHAKVAKYLGSSIKFVYTRNFKSKNFKVFSKYFPRVQKLKNLKNLDRLNMDGIIVAIPWILNDLYIDKFFKNFKKPILFEKPIGYSNKKIIDKIKFPDNKYLALNRRFYENIIYIKKKIEVKNISNVQVNISENFNSFKKRFSSLSPENVVFNTAIHVVDLLYFLFGKLRVLFKIGNLKKKDNNLIVILENESKIPIYLNITFNSPENNSIIIKTKDNKIYQLSPIENLKIFNKLTINIVNGQRKYQKRFKKEINEDYKFKPGFLNQMKNFIYLKKEAKISNCTETINLLKKIIK